jgi:2-keto-4-pentenoate hydratase/2-oxohepta-3-ene-1,7-dioic acid hydratase in catechol pathway
MKYISFKHNSRPSYGAVIAQRVADIGALTGAPADLRAAIASGKLAQLSSATMPTLMLDEVKLLPIIPNPAKILCVGHNYDLHRIEMRQEHVKHPQLFTRFTNTLVGAHDAIIAPSASSMLDYEGELAVIMGKHARRIPQADAMEYIAGYSCFNDASLRDWQFHTSQFTPGKNFPGTAPFGPWLVTPDEIADVQVITVTTRLNGERVQHGSVSDMIFSIAEIISYVSTFTELWPGDVIATGTPGGVGYKRQPPLWMKPGDCVEVEISGVGLLSSKIVAEC